MVTAFAAFGYGITVYLKAGSDFPRHVHSRPNLLTSGQSADWPIVSRVGESLPANLQNFGTSAMSERVYSWLGVSSTEAVGP